MSSRQAIGRGHTPFVGATLVRADEVMFAPGPKRDYSALSALTDRTQWRADAFRYVAMTLDRKVVLTDFHRKIANLRLGLA